MTDTLSALRQTESLPRRRNPSAGVLVSSAHPTLVFLTVTSKLRRCWLAERDPHRMLLEAWREAGAWIVGDYVVMPDHVHLFCAPVQLQVSVERWVRYWKSCFTKLHGRDDWQWQSRGWHHRMRSGDEYMRVRAYVRENPVRRGLVSLAEDWPFAGYLNELPWREQN